MSSIDLTFTRPVYLLLAIPSFLIILIPFLLLPAQRRKTFRKIAPVVLHLLVVSLLTLIISGFTVVTSSSEKAVMLVVDLSGSTKTVQQDLQDQASQILELVEENTPVGVVVFGQNQVQTVSFNDNRTFVSAKVDTAATDISGALEYAASLLPTDKAGQIILMSDGNQTEADANEAALRLASRGIRLDAVYFDTTQLDSAEVQLRSLKAPDGVAVGDTITFTADIQSNTEAEVTLSFLDGPTLVQREKRTIVPGSNLIELTCTAETAGLHSYQLTLDTSKDTFRQNNECYTFINISGEASVLVIADNLSNAQTLAAVLETDFSVTAATVWDAPLSIIELCNYDEIILSNVNLTALPANYDTLLQAYVQVYGRTLLAVGGDSTFMYGGMQATALEEMLPVELSLKDDSDSASVALMLVMDCSTSMQQGRNYLTIAKQGAIRCVEAMSGNDYVGIVSFSTIAQAQSPLIRATDNNKESLTRIISGLTTNRGTQYRDALVLAHDALANSKADIRHILFLSDGQPYDRNYMEAVESAAADGITVSTIGIGFSSGTLQSIATTGNGRYYYVSDATKLPSIMLSETTQIAVDSLITGDFSPVVARQSKLTDFLNGAALPNLSGYLGTTLKDDATAYITTADNHPIYAQWSYGKGVVGCFTSDLNGTWSSRWLTGDMGNSLIRNLVSTTVDTSRHSSSITVRFTPQGQTTQVTAITADTAPCTLTLSAKRAGNTVSYTMEQAEPGIYTARIDTVKAGVYELLITQTDENNNVVDHLSTALAVSYPGEYNTFAEGGQELMTTLCSYTGGQLYTDLQQLADVAVGSVQTIDNPVTALAAIAALLLLADIAIRKLRWKDIRNILRR